jgi:hypothetical protein
VGEATVDAVLYRNAAERFGVIADR